MEKSCHLDTLFRQVLEITDHVLGLPKSQLSNTLEKKVARYLLSVSKGHIPCSVFHLLPIRKELVEIPYTTSVFIE